MQATNTAGAAFSAAFQTACMADARTPACKVYIQWDGANWVDETLNLVSHQGEARLSAPDDSALLGQGTVGSATIALNNRNRRYSRLASGGDASLRAAFGGRGGVSRRGVRIYQGFTVGSPVPAPEYCQIFDGVIYDWADDDDQMLFSLQARDRGNLYLQTKVSTPVRRNYRLDEWIAELADAAGIAAGDRSLEPALFTVPWAWADAEGVMSEMGRAAQADGGWLYWNHHGKLLFKNLLAWAGQSSVWTITADDLTAIQPGQQIDLLATEVAVEWQPRQADELGVCFTLDERKIIGPGQTIEFEAKSGQPVWSYFLPEKDTDYRLVSSGGGDMNEHATVTLVEAGRNAQRATVRVTNNHATLPMILIWFQLRGIKLQGGPSQEIVVAATTPPLTGTYRRSVPSNVYIQSDAQATALASFLAERNSRLQPLWRLSLMRGTPAFELGDRITFSAAGRSVETPRDGHILAHAWEYGDDGFFSQTLEVLDREYLYPYSDYFVIGSTALGAGRAWY